MYIKIKAAWKFRRHALHCIKLSVMAMWWQIRDDTSWLHLYEQFLETYAAFTKAQERAMPEGYVYTVARHRLQEFKAITHVAERFRDTLARDMEVAAPKRYRFMAKCACCIYLTQGLTQMLTYDIAQG
jgi:hypothetical protein